LAIEAKAEGLTFEEFWERAIPPAKKGGRKRKSANREPGPEPDYGSPLISAAQELPPGRLLQPGQTEVYWPDDTFSRHDSYRGILDSEDGWRRAYLGLPPARGESALLLLAPAMERAARMAEELEDSGMASGADVPSPRDEYRQRAAA
jgi:hypothetical protein